MQPLQKLILIDFNADLPVYLQITNSFIHNIRRGRLRKGAKLPGTREVAALLKINRMTMVAAYNELQAQGWIEMVPRKGTFITDELPLIKPQKISEETGPARYPEKAGFPVDEKQADAFPASGFPDLNKIIINDGFPDTRLAPIELLMRNMRSISKQKAFRKYLMYGSPKGTSALCETLSAFLSDTRGLPISPNNIMITKGAQMGIYLTARMLLNPGDHVIVGEPGYFGANITFQQRGAILNKIPVDDHGIEVDAVEKICKSRKIKLLYVIPHHHHPTTVTLTPDRRIRLLELAERYKFAIIEDDYDYDFHYSSNPVLPMASLDQHGSVIYIGTFAKTLAPAIRIGFMVGAENFILAASNLRRSIDWQGDSLMELALSGLYKDGTIARHIKKSVKLYRERRDHFCHLLETKLGSNVKFKVPDGGMSVWATFIGADLEKVSKIASEKGLVISTGKLYNTDMINYNAARMGFASLNFEEQERAIEILGDSL